MQEITPTAQEVSPTVPLKPYQEASWRDMIVAIDKMKEVKKQGSFSFGKVEVKFPEQEAPLRIAVISDWHAGSFGTNYELWVQSTEFIKKNNILVLCVGDMLQMSIKMRGVLEMSDNAITPELQIQFLRSWIKEMGGAGSGGNLLAATWDNHAVMRLENQAGVNEYGRLFADVCPYFNGIGHMDVRIGEQTYKLAMSHFFRGRSMYNPVHSQMRYARMEASDREVIVAGDSHVPGFTWYTEAGMERVAINAGTYQENSGYGQRFFSLKTFTQMPCFSLDSQTHDIQVYKDMDTMVKATR